MNKSKTSDKGVLDVGLLDIDGQHPGIGGDDVGDGGGGGWLDGPAGVGDGEAGDLPHKHCFRVPGHLHIKFIPNFHFRNYDGVELDLEKPSCQPGSDGLLEADHQHLLLPDDPCDLAKALKELPHNDRLLPSDGQAVRLDEDLMVAGEGGQVVDVHVGVDEAALHLHHAVVSLLGVLLVIEVEEASCLVGVDEVDVKDVDAGEA